MYTTASENTQSITSPENQSELYHSTVQELYINANVIFVFYYYVMFSFIYRCVAPKEEVFEIDKTNWNDFVYVGCYARDIFKYLRQREVIYSIK